MSPVNDFFRKVNAGKRVEDIGLFGPTVQIVGGGISNAGRPRLPIRLPCDSILLMKFRQLIGEEGVKERLSDTVAAAQNMKLISKKQMETVVVDSTVQHKAVATRYLSNSSKPVFCQATRLKTYTLT